MRKILPLVLAASLSLAAVGCGSSGGSDADGATDKDTDKQEETTTTEANDETTTPEDDDEGTADDAAYLEALTANLHNGDADGGQLAIEDEADAQCVAQEFLDIITVDVLVENDVTPEQVSDPSWDGSALDLSLDQGQQMYDAWGDCGVDLPALLGYAMASTFTPEQRQCAADEIDPALAEAMMVKAFSGEASDDEQVAIQDQLTEACDLAG